MPHESVLISDSNPLYAEGLSNLLRTYGYRIVGLTTNVIDTIELISEFNPDLAIVDAVLVDSEGKFLIKKINKNFPMVRILALSKTDDDDLLVKSLYSGASGFMLKNLDGDVLSKRLAEIINN